MKFVSQDDGAVTGSTCSRQSEPVAIKPLFGSIFDFLIDFIVRLEHLKETNKPRDLNQLVKFTDSSHSCNLV